MKKMLVVLLAALILMLSVTAFADDEPVKLTLWTFQELHLSLYREMLDKWNADPANPKLDIDMQVMDYEDMHNKLTIALQTGEGAPDITEIEISMYANYLKGDIQLAPLNEYVEPIRDHLVMSRLNNYARDGKYYGIDHHIGATVMFYNTEILEEAGIDYKDIKTWDDFHEAGKVVLEKTGKPMTTWESSDCWSIYPIVSQHGGDWLTWDNEVVMDSDVVIDTLAFMKSMLEDGTAIPAPGGFHHAEEYWGWMNAGGCATVSMPFWYLNRFTDYMPDLAGKMKVVPLPTWADGKGHKSSQMGGTGVSVVATSPNADVAKAFIAFATLTFDGNVNTWKLLGFDPILMDVYGAPEMMEPNKFFDYYGDEIFDEMATVLDDIPDTAITDMYPTATDIVKSQMAYDLCYSDKSAEEIAKECADQLRSMID